MSLPILDPELQVHSAAPQDVGWLRALPADVRQRVGSDMRECLYSAGSAVAHRGETARSWIGVAQGYLKVCTTLRSGRAVMFNGVPEGCWIGEGAVITGQPRRYDVVAVTDSRILHLPVATFRWLQRSSLEFNRMLVERLNARLSQTISRIEIDRMEDPVARIARSISTLFDPTDCPTQARWLKLSQLELSELVGLSRTTISLGLRALEREGLLSTRYGGIAVQDLGALQRYEGSNERRPLRRKAASGP